MDVFKRVLWCVLVAGAVPASAQISSFPYTESFETVSVLSLPTGWLSTEKVTGNKDFSVTTGTPGSTTKTGTQAILTTGDKDSKYIVSPKFIFSSKVVDRLQFWDRRSSSSFNADVLVECSVDSTNFFGIGGPYNWTESSSFILHSISLPDSLSNQSHVWFRWRVVGLSSGSGTSTYRLDDISITTATTNDLSLSHLSITPLLPTRSDSIFLSVTVKNLAVVAATNYSVNFFIDGNNDAVAESNEQVASITGSPLAAGDSTIVSATHSPLHAGAYRCIAVVSIAQDENHANDTVSAVVTIGNMNGDVLVNEIMYAPTGDEPEWVELYNASSDTIDLKGWKISDSNISTKSIITSTDYFLPPMKFAVVAKSADFQSVHPNVSAIFTSFSALNNTTADDVVLYDATGTTIDSVMYAPSWGGQNGKSLERIDWQAASTPAENWKTSIDSIGSTPGRINSMARLDYDLALTNVVQTRSTVDGKIVPVVTATIHNVGRMAIDTMAINYYADSNRNACFDPTELLCSRKVIQHLAPLDSFIVSESLPQIPSGITKLIMHLLSSSDERTRNDTASISISIEYEQHALVINEIMYDPVEGQNEWLEFYNPGTSSVSIKNWRIHDKPTKVSEANIVLNSDNNIPAHGYFVVANDTSIVSSFPYLRYTDSLLQVCYLLRSTLSIFNNDGDEVVLVDQTGKTIDSVMYAPSWGGKNGKSLERIDWQMASTIAGNWGTSVDAFGGTPGHINSVARLDYDLALTNVVPTRSVVDGKIIPGVIATIHNVGRIAIDTMVVHFYADSNHNAYSDPTELLCSKTVIQHLVPLDSLVVSESLPQISSGNTKLILHLQSSSDERARNDTASISISIEYEQHALVINEIMYDPLEGQNEWLELYNAGNLPVDLYRWSFCDRPTASGVVNKFTIVDTSVILFPQHYFIATADSTIFALFPDLKTLTNGNLLLVLNRSGGFSFNSGGDAIQLKDLTGKTIDSVAYFPTWHNPSVTDTKGRSLERVNPLLGSNDPRNWSTCTNVLGGTPAKANSILTAALSSSATISLSPNPFSPDGDGFEDFCLISYHLPMSSAFVNVRLYDIKGRLIRTLANTEFVGSSGSFVWNGLGDNGQKVRIGVYVVYFEASEPISHQTVTEKKVVVVAAKL